MLIYYVEYIMVTITVHHHTIPCFDSFVSYFRNIAYFTD